MEKDEEINIDDLENLQNLENKDNVRYPSIKLEDKYNIKFNLVCQLFESILKAKTKSKIK